MERQEAVERITRLVGQDLRLLAPQYQVTVFRNDRKNKGWAGHVIERYLGIPINSSQSPNFGSWELKVIPLKYLRNGNLVIKETMAITMIDPVNVANTPFEKSHLLAKLQKAVIVARVWVDQKESTSILSTVKTFDLSDPMIYAQVKADYELVRKTIREQDFSSLTGKMGVYIQPRTKGPGHGSTSRAFYARKQFLNQIFFPDRQ
jgi:DNA mismatch repair protein MutH